MAKLVGAEPVKMILLGDSGGGKTGALASLAKAGYKLKILDFDNGSEILYHLLKAKPEDVDRVDVEKCLDSFQQNRLTKNLEVKTPLKAFDHALKCLDKWPGEEGSADTWGMDTVLVVDSLTMLGEAIFRYVLAANGKLGTSTDPRGGASEPNWGSAIGLQEDFLAKLSSADVKCHVIVTSHLVPVTVDGVDRSFPSALGKKLPPKVGRYFNHALLARSEKNTGASGGVTRQLYTDTQGLIELKSANPGAVKTKYPVTTGLGDYFKDMFGPLKAA